MSQIQNRGDVRAQSQGSLYPFIVAGIGNGDAVTYVVFGADGTKYGHEAGAAGAIRLAQALKAAGMK